MRHIYLATAILFGCVSLSYAAVYTWTDENGRTVYSQFPKPGAERKELKPLRNISGEEEKQDAKSTEEYLKAIEASNAARDQERAQAKRNAQQKAQQARDCADARHSLELLQRGGTTRYQQEDGSYSHYSEQKKAEEREKLQQYIQEKCH